MSGSELEPAGGDPIDDAEREAMVVRIQQALADNAIAFDDVDDRFEMVFKAQNRAELEAAVAGLPVPVNVAPPPDARHLAPGRIVSLIGDTKIGGWLSLGRQLLAISLIGDLTLDLSTASFPDDGAEVSAWGLIGDITVIVPDGARVQAEPLKLIGDRHERLVEPVAGGPVVRVKARLLIGDIKVYSLSQVPEGKLRRLWRGLRGDPSE